MTLSGGGLSRVFQFDSGTTAFIGGLSITRGYAIGDGGGLDNNGGTVTFTDCTVSGNVAYHSGGGLYSPDGRTTLTNCTVNGNSANYSGGGLFESGGTATLSDCTISGNSAVLKGGIVNENGTVIIGNTIVAENTASISEPDVSGTFASQGHNLIGETDGSSGWVGSDLAGTIAQPLNPLLAPLDNYGGPTETMALLRGSPAIDAGSNSIPGLTIPTADRAAPCAARLGLTPELQLISATTRPARPTWSRPLPTRTMSARFAPRSAGPTLAPTPTQRILPVRPPTRLSSTRRVASPRRRPSPSLRAWERWNSLVRPRPRRSRAPRWA